MESGRSGRRWLTALGLTFGVGLGNHLTLALMAPGLLVLILSARRRLPPTFRRDLALAALAFAGGLLVYLYLPIAASHRPPINWGDPVTFDRLLWVATGRLYASLPFGLPTAQLGTRLFALAGLIVNQFMPWGFLLALFGLFRLDSRRHNWWLATLVTFLAYVIYATAYATSDSEIYLIPAFAVMALWLAEGLSAIFERFGRSPLVRAALIAAAILAVALIPAAAHWQDQLLTQDWQAQNTFRALSEAEPNAVILTAGDRITFALWYAEAQPQQRPDVTVVNVNLYAFDWYRRSLAEKHPDLLPSVGAAPELEALIARWLTERPVYTAEDVGLPLQLGAATPSGILKRVVAVTN